MNNQVCIHNRFMGPPGIGNGGYVSGTLANNLSGRYANKVVEVTLRKPAPLDLQLFLTKKGDSVRLQNDEQIIAEARPSELHQSVPNPPTFAAVSAARPNGLYNKFHPFPHCFVCGPMRKDGLQIYPVPYKDMVAATWIPDDSLINGNGTVRPEFIWAALDCPGGVAAVFDQPRPILLGRLTGKIIRPVEPEKKYVVIGWREKQNGRKHNVGTAIFDENRELIGHATAVWLEPNWS